MLMLGIETSCDETSAGVVDVEGRKALSNVVAGQAWLHGKYGGVVPELASRCHLSALVPVVREALAKAGLSLDEVQGVAATAGPGLAGSLLVGLEAAKSLAWSRGLPFRGVNHLEGHLLACFLEHPGLEFPFLGLVVSGGHTSLFAVEAPAVRRLLASTRDDAAGEAYDKVAKLCGLGYPGGPALDQVAASHQGRTAGFPRAWMKDGSLDFSFSGLKTSVAFFLEGERRTGKDMDLGAVAAGFQEAATEAIIDRTLKAALSAGLTRIVLGGGVAANSRLRAELPERAAAQGMEVFFPSPQLCADNGAMIAYAGGLRLMEEGSSAWEIGVRPDWRQ
jgi:N6-L-threonylcarbamoyladenine synthase